jgi:plasmid stabilization system protein ParE
MTSYDLSAHAKQDLRQAAYEIRRRNYQAANGRVIRRMEGNGRDSISDKGLTPSMRKLIGEGRG